MTRNGEGEMAKDNTPWGLLKTMGLQDVKRLEPMRSQMMRGEKRSLMYWGVHRKRYECHCIKHHLKIP
jgi:hypothetical protein